MDASYFAGQAPIKVGYLMDIVVPESYPQGLRVDQRAPMDLVFKKGYEDKIIDRPVEVIYKEVDGMPRGTVKAVIDAYQELVDEGCLVVIGPSIVDNAVPTKL